MKRLKDAFCEIFLMVVIPWNALIRSEFVTYFKSTFEVWCNVHQKVRLPWRVFFYERNVDQKQRAICWNHYRGILRKSDHWNFRNTQKLNEVREQKLKLSNSLRLVFEIIDSQSVIILEKNDHKVWYYLTTLPFICTMWPNIEGLHWLNDRGLHCSFQFVNFLTWFKAFSKSMMRSQMFSNPTDILTRLSVIHNVCFLCSVKFLCDIMALKWNW